MPTETTIPCTHPDHRHNAELRTLTSEPAATLKRAERTVELACLGTGTGEVERTLNFCDRLLLSIRSTHKGGT